jgi:superoxide reductase
VDTQKQIYKCNVCGHIVEVLHPGAGQLVCCGQPTESLKEKIQDVGLEKHVPVIEKTPVPSAFGGATGQAVNGVRVKVGSIPHPMEEKHYIEWIEIIADARYCRKFLKPGDKPEAEFEVKAEKITAREYCNIHGLWKSA